MKPKSKTINLTAKYKFTAVDILVDECDAHLVVRPHIIKQNNGKLRAAIKVDGKEVYLHRLILGLTDSSTLVDHIDGNPLNNSRVNLRLATVCQNNCNRHKTKLNTTGYKGVWKRNDGRKKCWAAEIAYGGLKIKLGSFYTKEEAAKAYDIKALEIHKEFANLNFSDKEVPIEA